jgi:hypothetical protein
MITQLVTFRASRRKSAEISAVLIGQEGSFTAPLTVWDSQGGHGNGTWDWYYSTRPARPEEYADELVKLQRQYAPEYKIELRKRISRRHK